PLSIPCTSPPLDLHPFPTRRSSDLGVRRVDKKAGRCPAFFCWSSHQHEAHQENHERIELIRPKNFGTTLRAAPTRQSRPRRMPSDRKSTRLNSSHVSISYAVFCLKK